MRSTPRGRAWCAAAPWDPAVDALHTALSVRHCVPPHTMQPLHGLYYGLSKHRGSGISGEGNSGGGYAKRGRGDTLVLAGLNVALAGPWSDVLWRLAFTLGGWADAL
ncbi:hypothetical protein DPEC_G00268830 [Dallia pectoralis]|uniref:Uncharacterized protein n=1 Tax=Dallia pectoralis TaxID=75939 RepID=A0ACC2FP41_DALPE|nr:hypothetical protein DPEC_G00268830 [Dallia pectoralis]